MNDGRADAYEAVAWFTGPTWSFPIFGELQPVATAVYVVNVDVPLADGTRMLEPCNSAIFHDLGRAGRSLVREGTSDRGVYSPKSLKDKFANWTLAARVLVRRLDASRAPRTWASFAGDIAEAFFREIIQSDRSERRRRETLADVQLLFQQRHYLHYPPPAMPFERALRQRQSDIRLPADGVTLPLLTQEAAAVARICIPLVGMGQEIVDGCSPGGGLVDPARVDARLFENWGIGLNDALVGAWYVIFLLAEPRTLEFLALTSDCLSRLGETGEHPAVDVIEMLRFKGVRPWSGRRLLKYATPQVREAIAFLAKLPPGDPRGWLPARYKPGVGMTAINDDYLRAGLRWFAHRWRLTDFRGQPLQVTPTRLRKTAAILLAEAGASEESGAHQLGQTPYGSAYGSHYRRPHPLELREPITRTVLRQEEIYGFPPFEAYAR